MGFLILSSSLISHSLASLGLRAQGHMASWVQSGFEDGRVTPNHWLKQSASQGWVPRPTHARHPSLSTAGALGGKGVGVGGQECGYKVYGSWDHFSVTLEWAPLFFLPKAGFGGHSTG